MNYSPLTIKDIEVAFGFENYEAGEIIAQEFLKGTIRFNESELHKLAICKDITTEELIERDPALASYRNSEINVLKRIALRMLEKSFSVEAISELIGLPEYEVKDVLINKECLI